MASRKTLSKKIRFEVFKRDSFTCQYCGRMSPDVVLEVDHINPVANGGDNELINLITSCFDCNRGKGKKKLTDKDEVKIQQEQLKQLNKKREQLKMMLEWRNELNNFEDEQLQAFLDIYSAKTDYGLTDFGKEKVKTWIKQFGLLETIECMEISIKQYFKENKSKETINKTFDYIPKIANMRKKQKSNPCLANRNYIRGILKNRITIYNEGRVMKFLNAICIDDESFEEIKIIAMNCRNWTDFWNQINEVYEGEW